MFKKAIAELDEYSFEQVAMPYGIGCGLAGGTWEKYREVIDNAKTPVTIYKL